MKANQRTSQGNVGSKDHEQGGGQYDCLEINYSAEALYEPRRMSEDKNNKVSLKITR